MKNTKLTLLSAFLLITSISYGQKQWTLKECVDYALNNNLSIKRNKLNIEIAEKTIKDAKGNFLPTVNVSSNGRLSTGSSFNTVTQNRTPNTTLFGGGFGLSTNYNIFNGFRNLNTYRKAKLGVESSLIDLKIIDNDISLQVVNTYLNVLFAKENLEVARVQADISKKQIERAQAQFDAGAIPKGDLLNIQSTSANDAQQIVIQENSLNIALLQLSQLLQIPYSSFDVAVLKLDSPSLTLLYESSDIVLKKALKDRPEIEKAKLNIRNAELDIEIARSAYLPTISSSLSLESGYNYFIDPEPLNPSGGFLDQLDGNLGFGVGFSINVPIFNGFKTDANVEISKINKLVSENNFESEKLRLQQTIEQAYLDAKASAKTFEAATVSLDAQKEAFKNAQASLDYGAMTQFDYDQVRNRLVNAESALIRAKYDYVFKTKVLKFYYGENILD